MIVHSKILTSLVGLVVCAAFAAGPARAQSVQLRDGSILVGKIDDVDGEGFTMRLTINGGVLKLRWNHLTESSAKSLREASGLFNHETAVITVRADVVQYETSTGKIEEVMGRNAGRDGEFLRIRRRGDIIPIRRSQIRGIGERQVTPREIFTANEYYADLLAEAAPGEDADKHLALGEKLVRVRDYKHAEVHLKRAVDLGGGRQSGLPEKRLARLQILKGAADEQKLLDLIRTDTNRSNFASAQARIEEFKQKYPNTKLQSELLRVEKVYRDVRFNNLARSTARLWYKNIAKLAIEKSNDPTMTLAAAKQYATSKMSKEIRDKVAQTLSIEAKEAEDFWSKRFEVSGAVSGQHYYYSVGSWLLGESAILKDTKQGEFEAGQANRGKSEEDEKLEKGVRRIEEALRKARQARQRRAGRNAQNSGPKVVTPEEWWKFADRTARATWLKAYYAEFSGDMKVTSAHLSVCSNCSGAGQKVAQGTTGQARKIDCGVCHRTRFKRDVRAR